MIVASPRPVAAVSELPPLLRLRPDDLSDILLQQQSKSKLSSAIPMGNGNTDTESVSQNNCGSEVCRNGVTSISSSLMSGEQSISEPSPPPKYTRFSTTTFVYPLHPSHAARPSTSSTTSSSSNTVTGCGPASMSSSSCSTSTARPSFESFTTPSDHGFSQARGQQEQKEYHTAQYSTGAFQVQQRHPSSSSPKVQDELDNAPPYESSFRDTNLSGLPAEALSTLSLARENLSDLQHASFFAGYNLDDLDRSDDRADPDSIIQRRLTRNALLARQSAITLASASSGSIYSEPEAIVSAGNETRTSSLLVPQGQQRDSVYSTATTNDFEYDPLRVSVQTYGSSVLTYGSRASQLIDGDHGNYSNNNSSIDGNWNGSGSGSDGGRPVAPLPWLPRPSALDRIQHCGINLSTRTRSGSVGSNSGSGSGRRPLPPLPTPISATGNKPSLQTLTRDRSVSLPSRSISLDSNSPSGTGTVGGPRRAPRPLPRTPSAAIATSSNLPDILEGQASDVTNNSVNIGGNGVAPSSGPVRSNSMLLSPTSAVSTSPLNLRSRRNSSARYSTIGYGHAARVGMRGVFSRGNDSEGSGSGLNEIDEASAGRNAGAQKPYSRAASRASMRSARSTFLVPDVDELVRILDSMDDSPGSTNSASGSGSSPESCLTTPLPGSVPGPALGLWGRRISNASAFGKKSVISAGKDKKGDEDVEVEDGEVEIDMGEALACSRSVVNVPCGERRGAVAALEDLGINIGIGVGAGIGVTAKNSSSTGTAGIGLPTPAATPRNSPHRQPTSLPGSSKNSANIASATPPPPPPPKLTHHLPQSSHARNQLPPPPTSSPAQSPALSPSDTDALSLTSFPLPPVAPLFIPAPSAVGAAEMPIPSASSTGIPPSPSLLDVGKSPAERALLPGMSMTTTAAKKDEVTPTHPKHITAREAIADLKHRVAELPKFTFPASVRNKGVVKMFPSGVPLLGFPIPPRRRAQSTSTSISIPNAPKNPDYVTNRAKKHAFPIPPAIDVHVANALPPPTSFSGLGRVTPGSSSAPPNNQTFELDKPTIIYTTPELAPAPALAQPPVAPLKIRSTSSRRMEVVNANGRVPMTVAQPQSAEAVKTSFNITACSGKQGKSSGRAQRATSFCVSPSSSDSPGGVAPLRFKTSKAVSRARSSTIGAVAVPSVLFSTKQQLQKKDQDKENVAPAVDRKSSETDGSEESESDHLPTPTAPNATLPNIVEARASEENENEARGHQHRTISSTAGAFSILSSNTNNTSTSFSILHQPTSGAQTHISIDPAFADLIKSMSGASEEEQMGSLLTIASSINTEHHASSYNAGFFVPLVDESRTREDDGFVDVDDEDVNMGYSSPNEGALRRQEIVRKSMASGISATGSITERRKSKTRSISSSKKRHSARSAAAVRAAIRALPDPNTFPLPTPDSGGSVATDLSAQAAGADYHRFGLRPSPLPKLRVVTKFKGGTVLLPATYAPLSAASTKSTMSTFGAGGHSRNASAVSVVSAKRSSTTTGVRKMNRLTLTDPRSPMGEAAVAAATLVARVRQKRAALAASRNRPLAGAGAATAVNSSGNNNGLQSPTVVHVMTRGHARTGSGSSATQTLKSKLKMSGGSFFGGY